LKGIRKRYIIFIENLHELFKQLDVKELQKLRSIFQKYDFFSVVASAPMIFPGISEHDEPFYNFFQIQFLSEFSLKEIKYLIKKIAEAENNKEFLDDFKKYEPKIHGISHLTGGSPRLVILFYEMIARGELENIENAFFKIIDEHTPYYQEIFQFLTGQKRRIFDAVISSEAPITPKQISEVARLDLPTVTTQLRRLEQDGYVISRPMGRYTKYEVRERLFRLWREMRQPLGKKRVSILLEFLQFWYTTEKRKELFRTKFEMLEAGEKRYEESLEAFKNAVEIFPKDEDFIESTIEICFNFALDEFEAGNRGNSTKFMKVVHEIGKELKEDRFAMLTINFLKNAADSGDIQIVKVAVDEIIKLFGNKYEERIKPIIKAIEIVETKDIQKYYNLQIEEREIVGDIVKKITGSDELLPESLSGRNGIVHGVVTI
jgi:DNA-binding transcriptional ArsR family regulator